MCFHKLTFEFCLSLSRYTSGPVWRHAICPRPLPPSLIATKCARHVLGMDSITEAELRLIAGEEVGKYSLAVTETDSAWLCAETPQNVRCSIGAVVSEKPQTPSPFGVNGRRRETKPCGSTLKLEESKKNGTFVYSAVKALIQSYITC